MQLHFHLHGNILTDLKKKKKKKTLRRQLFFLSFLYFLYFFIYLFIYFYFLFFFFSSQKDTKRSFYSALKADYKQIILLVSHEKLIIIKLFSNVKIANVVKQGLLI